MRAGHRTRGGRAGAPKPSGAPELGAAAGHRPGPPAPGARAMQMRAIRAECSCGAPRSTGGCWGRRHRPRRARRRTKHRSPSPDRPHRARPRGAAGSNARDGHRLERRAARPHRDADQIDRDPDLAGRHRRAGGSGRRRNGTPATRRTVTETGCPMTRASAWGIERAGRFAIARVRRVIWRRRCKPSTAPAATIPQPNATARITSACPGRRCAASTTRPRARA